jgi:hypothetical protein
MRRSRTAIVSPTEPTDLTPDELELLAYARTVRAHLDALFRDPVAGHGCVPGKIILIPNGTQNPVYKDAPCGYLESCWGDHDMDLW